jgi:hypothetical protein
MPLLPTGRGNRWVTVQHGGSRANSTACESAPRTSEDRGAVDADLFMKLVLDALP